MGTITHLFFNQAAEGLHNEADEIAGVINRRDLAEIQETGEEIREMILAGVVFGNFWAEMLEDLRQAYRYESRRLA